MNLRAIFKDGSFLHQLLLTIAIVCVGASLSVFVFAVYLLVTTGSWNVLPETVNDMRIMQLFSVLGTFFVPALFLAYVFSENIVTYLQLHKPQPSLVLLTVAAILFIMPFLNLVIHLNEQLVLPESLKALEVWMKQMEETARQLTSQLMETDSLLILVFNLFLIGVVAAVSEELMFRGVLQRIFEKFVKNPQLVIWMVAFIFSAVHLQFYGFLPRMLLGALMGYLLLWTKSLWIPVVAHFTNNAVGVLLCYLFPCPETTKQLDLIGTGDTLWVAGVSLVLTAFVCRYIRKISRCKRSPAI